MSKLERSSEVAEIMTSDVGSVTEHAYVSIAEIMRDSINVRHIPVVDSDGTPIGIISIRDILDHYKEIGSDGSILAGDIMSSPVLHVEESTPIHQVAKLMQDNKVSSILVVQGTALSGIVTERDFLKLVV